VNVSPNPPRPPGAQHPQGMAASVFEGLDCRGDFQHAVAHCIQPVRFIGFCEQFSFGHAGPVGDGDEFHRFAGDLVEQALLDYQAASDDLFADVIAQPVDGAIGVPGDVGEEFERVSADRVTQKFLFPTQALEMSWFNQRNGGKPIEILGRQAKVAAPSDLCPLTSDLCPLFSVLWLARGIPNIV